MRLKDIKINAEDLLNFLNKHIAFEHDQSIEGRSFTLNFHYKIEYLNWLNS